MIGGCHAMRAARDGAVVNFQIWQSGSVDIEGMGTRIHGHWDAYQGAYLLESGARGLGPSCCFNDLQSGRLFERADGTLELDAYGNFFDCGCVIPVAPGEHSYERKFLEYPGDACPCDSRVFYECSG